jgi:hypothetical protein
MFRPRPDTGLSLIRNESLPQPRRRTRPHYFNQSPSTYRPRPPP